MWTLGEFDFQVASDDPVRPKRTVSAATETVRLSAIAVGGTLPKLRQQCSRLLTVEIACR